MDAQTISEIVHNTMTRFVFDHDEKEMPQWEVAPQWMKDSTLNMVAHLIENPDWSAEDIHEKWLERRQHEGWVYGPEKNMAAKTSPWVVPYAELPETQKRKDILIKYLVFALHNYC
jgi:hypothetical protein